MLQAMNIPLVLQGRYFSTEEAAEALGYSPVTVNLLVRKQAIIPVWVNRKSYIIPESEVERLRNNPPKIGRPRKASKKP